MQTQALPFSVLILSTAFESGVNFGPWLREFVPSLKRHWAVPHAVMSYAGHVVVTFRVAKDGSIHNLRLKERSWVAGFNEAAMNAMSGIQTAPPLPVEFAPRYASFTVTFFHNETWKNLD